MYEGPHFVPPVPQLRRQRAEPLRVVLYDVAGEGAVLNELPRRLVGAPAEQQRHTERRDDGGQIEPKEAPEDERRRRPREGLRVAFARELQGPQRERVARYHEEHTDHRWPTVQQPHEGQPPERGIRGHGRGRLVRVGRRPWQPAVTLGDEKGCVEVVAEEHEEGGQPSHAVKICCRAQHLGTAIAIGIVIAAVPRR